MESLSLMSHGLNDPDSTPGGDKDFFLRHEDRLWVHESLLLSSGNLELKLKRRRREAIYVRLVPKLRMTQATLPTPHGFLAYRLIT